MAKRTWVMSVLVLGLALSYSGSGLLCLTLALLFSVRRETIVRIVAFGALVAALFVNDAMNLSFTLNRVSELGSSNSSAYLRWIAPTEELVRQIDSDPWTSVLGNGPGSMKRITADSTGQATFAKAPFEYGLVGTLAFGVLIVGALNRSAAPVGIRVVAGVGWLLIGGLLDAMFLLFIYLISAMWPKDTARTLRSGARAREARRGRIER